MDAIEMELNDQKRGSFFIGDAKERLAEMVFLIDDKVMTVLHTEVAKELEGKGIAARILDRMAAYARENKLAVVPRCAYVNVQFRRHPEKYNDIWKKD